MYWIPLLLLGLNLGGASATGSGEASASQPNAIARLNDFMQAHPLDHLEQMKFVKEQLRDEPENEVLKAFVALEPLAPHIFRSFLHCNKNQIQESLEKFAKMGKVLSEIYSIDLLISREQSPIPIVQSICDLERGFLQGCLSQNYVLFLSMIDQKLVDTRDMAEMTAFFTVGRFSSECPYSEQARKLAEGELNIAPPFEGRSGDGDGTSASLDEEKLKFCEETCGKVVEPLRSLLNTGLQLLEAARPYELDIVRDQYALFEHFHFNYLVCMSIRDYLSEKLSLSYEAPQ